MHPVIFKYQIPNFFKSFLGIESITLYSYAFFIVLGTVLAAKYAKINSEKANLEVLPNTFFYTIFIGGFIGGKFFTWLENPKKIIENPKLLLDIFSGGFVFYGSLIVAIIFAIWYLKRKKYPILVILDIMSIATVIAHFFGRLGCFFAGCCYGKPTDSHFGIEFPTTKGEKVIPTQLIEASVLLIIGIILYNIKNKEEIKGKLFLVYLILYAIFRFFIEFLRGDFRGIIFQSLSHSQFIAILFILISGLILYQNKFNTNFKY
jgi:phosphatidylglycerol:prolipoprotein diacylglycerol transferase